MKIRRVIRFQCDFVEEKKKQENPENQKILERPKKDISSNNDILVEENLQEHSEDSEEDIQEIQYNASNELIRCVKRVVSGRASTNMIGVFGINSDVIVNNLCHNLREVSENLIFAGQADCSSALSDVYNNIAAIFYKYLRNNFTRQYDIEFYLKDVMIGLEKVYDNHQEYDEYQTTLVTLKRINERNERDRNLLSVINRIKQIINSSSFSRNYDSKFLVILELKELDYKTLKYLSKLNSSDLVIVVFSLYDYDLARTTLRNSLGRDCDCMEKFFYSGNYVTAEGDAV